MDILDSTMDLFSGIFNCIGETVDNNYISKVTAGFTSGQQLVSGVGTGDNLDSSSIKKDWGTIGNYFVNDFNKHNYIGDISDVYSSIILAGSQAAGIGYQSITEAFNFLTSSSTIASLDSISATGESFLNNMFGASVQKTENISSVINGLFSNLGTDNVFFGTVAKGISIFTDGTLTYQNGVDETSFGNLMENSWNKGSNSFINTFKNGSSSTYKVNISNVTPLDSGENMYNLYGTLLLGVPPIFTHITDPKNRAITNTFLKDAKFLSLTPGYPQYNGSYYLSSKQDDQLHQTTTGESMMEYLLRNGIDKYFDGKDKRYYKFKANYDEYFAYLETMLNTIWIKMGLGTESSNTFNIFSFFDIDNSGKLLSKYKSPLGFFVNPAGSVTESINSSPTSYGSSMSSEVNGASDTYKGINYLTGMGTGGNARNAMRKTVTTMGLAANIKDFIKTSAENTIAAVKNVPSSFFKGGAISYGLGIVGGLYSDTRNFLTEKDQGATLQAFATTNGMNVVYPELWSDTNYSKSFNINFEFISPYGDPLSIFKYVMVPFASLLTFAMPRQAADNGYVSPFFIRGDIPGVFTCDLGLITDFTWSRGGSQELWTKDGLPRAISGSFTIGDLYPYLAMTKRLSFLSANPSYTVFLDSLAGLHANYLDDSENNLNEYWKAMLNRVSGESDTNGLWNSYNSYSRETNKNFNTTAQTNRMNHSGSSVDWLRNIK